jgi:hypothetical protein
MIFCRRVQPVLLKKIIFASYSVHLQTKGFLFSIDVMIASCSEVSDHVSEAVPPDHLLAPIRDVRAHGGKPFLCGKTLLDLPTLAVK